MASAMGDDRGVDLNSADQADLERVGGLGEERARRLVQSRPFRSWEDLKKIDGFSDKLIDDLRRSGARLGPGGHA